MNNTISFLVLDLMQASESFFLFVFPHFFSPFGFISEGTWNFSEPKAVSLGKNPVMAIAVVSENLWCSCGNKLFIISRDDEVVKVGKLCQNMVHRQRLKPRSVCRIQGREVTAKAQPTYN